MVNKRFWQGILVMVLIFGMTVIGCDNGTTTDDGGVLTLTDIPAEYNGKYILLEGQTENSNEDNLVGCDSADLSTETITLTKISNGTASIPLWEVVGESLQRYSGNASADFEVEIYNENTLSGQRLARFGLMGVAFSNGSATKSYNTREQ